MDVLEHLVDPLATLRKFRELLPNDGLLFLQTPCHHGDDEHWEMLIPKHLHLFTNDGIRRFLERAGFLEVELSSDFFSCDMWIVTPPRGPIHHIDNPHQGLDPLLLALIDGLTERRRIQCDLDWSEKTREELQAELGSRSDSALDHLRQLPGRQR